MFAPLFISSNINSGLSQLFFLTSFSVILVLLLLSESLYYSYTTSLSVLFNTSNTLVIVFMIIFMNLSLFNLMSMIIYSYPVTTTLSFNLSVALLCWVSSILLQTFNENSIYILLPSNSPWYLIPFLCLVEFTSIIVRPITLCFRLLANITAGHVLLALICNIPLFWLIGVLFGSLELMVALVQAFVFAILISVYFDEVLTH